MKKIKAKVKKLLRQTRLVNMQLEIQTSRIKLKFESNKETQTNTTTRQGRTTLAIFATLHYQLIEKPSEQAKD